MTWFEVSVHYVHILMIVFQCITCGGSGSGGTLLFWTLLISSRYMYMFFIHLPAFMAL